MSENKASNTDKKMSDFIKERFIEDGSFLTGWIISYQVYDPTTGVSSINYCASDLLSPATGIGLLESTKYEILFPNNTTEEDDDESD